jgi:hypothetical protein
MGVLAGFGHDDFIARQHVDIVRRHDVRPEEEPEQTGPG